MESLVTLANGEFSLNDLTTMEITFLAEIDYRIHSPTAFHHLGWFHDLSIGEHDILAIECSLLEYVAELGLSSLDCPSWAPSHLAVAAVIVLNQLLQHDRPLPPAVHGAFNAVIGIANKLCELLRDSIPGNAIFDKYAVEEHEFIAQKVDKLLVWALPEGFITFPLESESSFAGCGLSVQQSAATLQSKDVVPLANSHALKDH